MLTKRIYLQLFGLACVSLLQEADSTDEEDLTDYLEKYGYLTDIEAHMDGAVGFQAVLSNNDSSPDYDPAQIRTTAILKLQVTSTLYIEIRAKLSLSSEKRRIGGNWNLG